MKAVLVRDDGERTLVWTDVDTPRAGPHEVLIAVHATAVNRADLLQRRGLYPPPAGESAVLGLEAAGVIAEVGAKVRRWQTGDRVACLLGSGGYGEYVAAHEDMPLALPASLGYAAAAAIPEAYYTAFLNLVLEARLARDETVLIHAGGSGVGTAAIQLAAARGARVLVTAGTDEKVRRCRELGAEAAINYKQEDFAARVKALTEERGVDVVLDCVGGSYLAQHLGVLRPRGRLVVIGLMGGAQAEINLGLVVAKRLTVIGSVLRSRALPEKLALTEAFRAQVWPLMEQGRLRPVVDRTYPITEVEAAHAHVAANRNFGKVVLQIRA